MRRKKSLVRRLIPLAIVLILGVLLTVFVIIPLYGSQSSAKAGMPPIRRFAGDDDALVMENDALRFELDAETTQFVVTDKQTGHQWRSNPKDAAKDPLATAGENKARLQSTLIATSMTTKGVTKDMNNYAYSIENGLYEAYVQEDGSIRVDYTVGEIGKMYVFPLVITEERLNGYLAKMAKRDATSTKDYYRLLDRTKLKADELPALLAMYPALETTNLYALRDADSKSFNDRKKRSLQEKFVEAGYTADDLAADNLLIAGTKEINVAAYNISMIYRLEGGDLVVQIPYDDIETNAEYALTSLTVLPAFGAAGVADEGFMFVPEGGGALIRYNNKKLSQNNYVANLYGWDYSSERLMLVNETRANFPVFGMATGGESFLCFMEGMTSLSSVQAAISGRTNSYNQCNAKYIVQHGDKYNVSAKTSQMVYMFESVIPQGSIQHRYRFLPSSDYVDMAVAYRDYLMWRYPDLIGDKASGDMPVLIEFVGAIDKTVQRAGLPIVTTTPTTTFDQARDMLATLSDSGIRSLSVRMSGWCNGGVSQQVFTSVRTLSELGGDRALKELIRCAQDTDAKLYLEGVSAFAYRSNVLQGFLPFRDAARFTTREEVKIQPYNSILFIQTPWLEPFYLVKPTYAERCAQNFIARASELGAQGVAFRDIGSLLSGDYDYMDNTSRQRVLDMNVRLLQQAGEKKLDILIKQGNDYAVPYATLIADMDMTGTPYSIIDLNVPFYQIALHGLKDYVGNAVNLTGDYVVEILKAAEYGAGLNFTFMGENPEILQDTVYCGYFASSWENWRDTAIDEITRFQTAMKGLGAARISGHTASPDGEQTVTTYDNGTRVYVNYGLDEAVIDGVTVPSRSYHVEGGDAQ